MKILIEDIENAPESMLDVDFCEIIDDLENGKEVRGKLEVKSNGATIEVKGHINTTMKLVCDRCLSEFDYDVDADIDEVFVKENVFDYSKHEIELKNDNFVVELNGETEIDITDLVYQSVIINIPTKKICRHGCEGTIPVLSEEEKIDPRLEVFKRLTDKIKEER